jgi:hypothetical protein
MDLLLLIVLIVAVLALSGWGYGYYAARPVPGAVVEGPPAGAGPLVSLIGVIGLILLIAFFAMLATGWRFGLDVQRPW